MGGQLVGDNGINVHLPKSSKVTLTIYDILGKEIKKLADDEKQPGNYYVTRDGTNNRGSKVSSGIYLYRIETDGGYVRIRKMLLLK